MTELEDVGNFEVGLAVTIHPRPPWWRRALAWLARVVLRRRPLPDSKIVAIDRERGTITLEGG